MDDEILLFLLRGGHLSMPDRIATGAWPHPPLHFDSVADFLSGVLATADTWFPYRLEDRQLGEPVREGGTIERKTNQCYVYRNAAAHPGAPSVLNRSVELEFSNAHDAAAHYLRTDLNLPGDLDGWKVE